MTPAALTRISRSGMVASSDLTASLSVTSRCSIRIPAGIPGAAGKPAAMTFAPEARNASAIARPMPLVPPVMRAVLLLNWNIQLRAPIDVADIGTVKLGQRTNAALFHHELEFDAK